jgi:hypothetical protein
MKYRTFTNRHRLGNRYNLTKCERPEFTSRYYFRYVFLKQLTYPHGYISMVDAI